MNHSNVDTEMERSPRQPEPHGQAERTTREPGRPGHFPFVQLQPGGIAEMFYGTDCEQIILSKRKVPRRATPRPRLAGISSRAAPVSRGSAASLGGDVVREGG